MGNPVGKAMPLRSKSTHMNLKPITGQFSECVDFPCGYLARADFYDVAETQIGQAIPAWL